MFKLSHNARFSASVTVYDPSVTGEPPTFTGHFKIRTETEISKLLNADRPWTAASLTQEQAEDVVGAMTDAQQTNFARAVLDGWGDDIQDESGQPLPYTAENRDRALALPFVRLAVASTYLRAIAGQLRGNAKSSPSASPAAN